MAVKVHHLNCGTMRAYGLFPFSTMPLNDTGKWFGKGLGVIHCLLVDTGEGLFLVDTGFGTRDYLAPTPMVRNFKRVIGLEGVIGETALHQVITLGYAPSDIKDIFLTHMHLDHTGGLPDFPQARVHIYEREAEMVVKGRGIQRKFYIDQHWAHGPDWQVHGLEGDSRLGFECTPPLNLGGVEVCLVPMTGHSPGHCMAALGLPDGGWVVHAGDAYGYHGQIDPYNPHYPPYQRLFRPLLHSLRTTRAMFQHDQQLRRLRKELGSDLTIFCAHDPHEYQRLAGEKIP